MIPHPTRITLALLATTLVVSAFPSAQEPEFKAIFEIPEPVRFTARFGAVLQGVPPAELPQFREALARELSQKKLKPRHTSRALSLTDAFWAESDVRGFIEAAKEKPAAMSVAGRQRAARILLQTDVDAAIRLACDFQLSHGSMAAFAADLAASEPKRALTLFKERGPNQGTYFDARPMFIVWARNDAAAAWTAAGELAGVKGVERYAQGLRNCVSAQLAQRDLPAALRLVDTLEPAAIRGQALSGMVAELTADDVDSALLTCRQIDRLIAWQAFVKALSIPDDKKTMRLLLESLPEAHRESLIEDFFFSYDDPVLPTLHRARLIALIDDPALRQRMLLAAVEAHTRMGYRAFPDNILDGVMEQATELLSAQVSVPVRTHLLRQMVAKDPMKVLPWVVSLSDAQWRTYQGVVLSGWDMQRYEQDIPSLLADERSRAKLLGDQLLDYWVGRNPAAAFAVAARHAPDRIAGKINFHILHKELGGDFGKIEELINGIADPKIKTVTWQHYMTWSIGELPPDKIMSLVGEHLAGFSDGLRERLLDKVAWRREPEFDMAPSQLPKLSEAERDTMRGNRARSLFLANEEERALKQLRDIKDDQQLFSALYYMNTNGDFAITRWDELLGLIGARKDAPRQKDVISLYARKLVEARKESAPHVVGKIPSEEFRAAFGAAVAECMPTKKNGDSWERAVQLGLQTEEGRAVGIRAIRMLANDDPKQAITILMAAGPDAMRQEFVDPVIDKFIAQDPEAAFRTLQAASGTFLGQYLSKALREWSYMSPAAACQAAFGLIENKHQSRLYESALEIWLREEEGAARDWALTLPPGPARQSAVAKLIQQQCKDAPAQAAQLFLAEITTPENVGTATLVAQSLASRSYADGCRFLLSLDGTFEARGIIGAWRNIILAWHGSDPAGVRVFLASLPETGFVKSLSEGLQGIVGLAAPAAGAATGGGPEDLLALITSGKISRMQFNDRQWAQLKTAVIESPEQGHHLAPLCVHLVQRGMYARLQDLLREIDGRAAKSPEPTRSPVPQVIHACMDHLRQNDPREIPAFLDSLAAVSPEWLEAAVSALWSLQRGTDRIDDLLAQSLLRLAPEKRAGIMARSFAYGRSIPPELAAMLSGEDLMARQDPQLDILAALTRQDLTEALRLASLMPASEGDSVVRAVLAAFPSRKEAQSAIERLDKEPGVRVRAWHEALDPEIQP